MRLRLQTSARSGNRVTVAKVLLLGWGVLLSFYGWFFTNLAHARIDPPPHTSVARLQEASRYRGELQRFAPNVLRFGLVVFGLGVGIALIDILI